MKTRAVFRDTDTDTIHRMIGLSPDQAHNGHMPGSKHSSDNEQRADQYTEYVLAYDTSKSLCLFMLPLFINKVDIFFSEKNI